ncbi:MAG TPA: S41 family peptidase [Cyclobacteriaceae bacterium]|jgi:carboxyl-terminal processing protease|nr:S41 family peptidase [Cyclobacteriaceae bacterium]
MKGKKWRVVIFLSVATGLLAFTVPTDRYFDIAKSLDIFATLVKEVNANYVDEVDPKKLIDTGINGMLQQLDPYTDYIPKEDMEAFSIQTTGEYAGIGALVGQINHKTVITFPYLGFPANRAGIRVGDELISINGKNVQGKPTGESSVLLKGTPQTEVEVEVKRYGEQNTMKFKVLREKIKISNVTYVGLIDNELGYVKLDEFTPGASREVADAVAKLKSQGAKKLILDLRDNPGGSLYEAVNIVNIFVPKGKEVVSTKGKSPESNKTYNTLNNPIDLETPLTVLTSGSSASASEIVAGSLQDYDRAVLVGQRTFGKGLVQTTRQLAYDAQLKITTAKYYIPSGRCIQALDYAHRHTDGTVGKFPDSLKREFKTKVGRKVYDGAGLDPDIEVKPEEIASLTVELVSSGLMFEYASKYCSENKTSPQSMKSFRVNDAEYDKFISWITTQSFSFTPDLERKVDALIASAKTEKYYDHLQNSLVELKSKITQSRSNDLIRFKVEISRVLEEEIAFHYSLSQGQVDVSLDRDPEILAAKKLLNDRTKYNQLLSAQ